VDWLTSSKFASLASLPHKDTYPPYKKPHFCQGFPYNKKYILSRQTKGASYVIITLSVRQGRFLQIGKTEDSHTKEYRLRKYGESMVLPKINLQAVRRSLSLEVFLFKIHSKFCLKLVAFFSYRILIGVVHKYKTNNNRIEIDEWLNRRAGDCDNLRRKGVM
jgi:hypothetical protein